MPPGDTSHHDLVFLAEGVPAGASRVRRLVAREGLSTPYLVEVDIELIGAALDPRAWLGTPAQVVVLESQAQALLRRFSGLVAGVVERASRDTSRQRLSLKLEPPLAGLRLSADYRVFQQQTTQQIVTTLLAENGVPEADVAWRLTGSYPSREVCTQLGESAFSFVSRLLEEDGIFYFFEFEDDRIVTVFGDSSSAYAEVEPEGNLRFRGETGLTSGSAVTHLTAYERVRPAKVTLRDHDFKRPQLDLEAEAEGQAALGREHYDYPGRYVDPAEGQRRAQLRLDAMTAASTGVRGASTAAGLTAGHTFTLTGADDPSLEGEWVVCEVEHTIEDVAGGDTRVANRFRLLPRSATYRPPARAPRAIAPGPQVARVTGPPGEEIHTDEHGRVKVSFPWDRRTTNDDKSSSWVRVGQMHTSGSVAIPRVGWEVVIDFEDGDPDKPVILGRVYNGVYGPPYPLPAGKTMSSLQSMSSPGGGGQNEIRMEDGAGGEHVAVRAQKDLNVVVANNKTEKIATNETVGVGADHALDVGAAQTLRVGAKQKIEVGASQTWAVGASRTKTVAGAEQVTVKGARSLSIGGSHTTMTPQSVSTTTAGSLSETVGGSCIEAAAMGVTTAVAGAASVTVGGSKLELTASGKSDTTVGARASTVGGAFISASGKDVGVSVGGAKATTVGGILAMNAAGDVELSSGATLSITVGGAVALNAAKIVLKVGGSNVTLAAGSVVVKSREIKLTATGPHAELSPLVADK